MIPFNKPYLSGNEISYIENSIRSGKISGDGIYTKKVHDFFEQKYLFRKCLLTTSCTDALEMCSILLDIKEGDEIIMPAYTFVSTANAFVLRGAKIVFVDSRVDHPGMDETAIEKLITTKTKAIVVVHYAGIACDMDLIMNVAKLYNLYVVEDAAQAIDAYYVNNEGKKIPLGSIGHLAAFSFHETKNIICGEGGMLVINDEKFIKRAEIIREKGTNRSAFFRGEIDKYGWVDIGSSFLPSDILAAYLYAQLENIENIQGRRKEILARYVHNFKNIDHELPFSLANEPSYAISNAHMFYLIFKNTSDRSLVIENLRAKNVHAVFHYLSLNNSSYYNQKSINLPNSERYSDTLLRLPFFYEIKDSEVDFICETIVNTFK
jgi:dTDP-4-amino-4,6-dideoxygalactose transaminase